MSWSQTFDNMRAMTELPYEASAAWSDNPAYQEDVLAAFALAKHLGFVSAALSGARTASPYGGPEHVVISIVGFDDDTTVAVAVERQPPSSFQAEMLRRIEAGPDEEDDPAGGAGPRGASFNHGPSYSNGPWRPLFDYPPLSVTFWDLI